MLPLLDLRCCSLPVCLHPRPMPGIVSAHQPSNTSLLSPAPCSKWAAQQGHLPSADAPVRFVFDGDQLDPEETPAGLDLDGEEIIEVHF